MLKVDYSRHHLVKIKNDLLQRKMISYDDLLQGYRPKPIL